MNEEPNKSEGDFESLDAVLIEFNDTDYPWEKVPPEEAEKYRRQINRRRPNTPPKLPEDEEPKS